MSSDSTWVQTVSGAAFDMLNPKQEQVHLHDIAWSLSRLARFNGHTTAEDPLSVAQHSLLVEALLPSEAESLMCLAALLHDAHEAYVSDVPSPMLRAINLYNATPGYYPSNAFMGICSGIDRVVHAAFALPYPMSNGWYSCIRDADMLALRLERDAWMSPIPREWMPLPEPPAKLSERVVDILAACWTAKKAYERFIARIDALVRQQHRL